MTLQKAVLHVLDRQGKPVKKLEHVVQFNPTTMSLQTQNTVDGAKSRGRQRQQFNGKSSTTLSLDLEYDTADEGTTAQPIDVRTKTDKVRQFVLPGGKKSKEGPPRVKFQWGTFELTGVMSSLSEELSFFSSQGVPLRSKVSVQIKEQDLKFEALKEGPGANRAAGATPSGEKSKDSPAVPGAGTAGGAGGTKPKAGPVDAVADALDGETPADFLARNGLPPEAWRALGTALDTADAGLELAAGAAVGFNTALNASAGIGASAGFQAGIGGSVGASLGLEASASAGASVGASASALAQGHAMAAAGGFTAAAEASASAEAHASASAALDAFGAEASAGASASASAGASAGASVTGSASAGASAAASFGANGGPTRRSGESPRQPLRAVAGQTLRVGTAAPAALPPLADKRMTTFGRGVPLRDRVVPTGSTAGGYVVVGKPSAAAVRSATSGRRPAPWEQLTSDTTRDRAANAAQPSCGCNSCGPLGGH